MQVSHLAPQKQTYAIKKISVPSFFYLFMLILFYTWASSRGAFAPKNISKAKNSVFSNFGIGGSLPPIGDRVINNNLGHTVKYC